jgi:hypothetical protein
MERENKNSKPRFFALGDARPLVVKFLIPAILILGSFPILRATAKPLGIVLGALIGILGVTYFVITSLVRAEVDCLYYRRFFEWRRLEYAHVLSCGRSAFLPLCYIKLRRFEPPLGKIYFVLYSPVKWMWQQPRVDDETMTYIRSRIGLRHGQ